MYLFAVYPKVYLSIGRNLNRIHLVDIMEPNPYLALSSLFLLLPVFPYAVNDDYLGMFLSCMCSFFSMSYHSTKPSFPILLLLDKIFGYSTVVYSFFMMLQRLPYSIYPFLTLVLGGFVLYHTGYQYKQLIWNPDIVKATRWHMVFHLGNGLMCTFIMLSK